MPTLEIEVAVYCSSCKGELQSNIDRDGDIIVEPCENCFKESHDDGYLECEKDNNL